MLAVWLTTSIISGCSNPAKLPDPKISQGSKIYDIHGKVIATIFKEKRTAVPLKEIPEITRQAVISVEDNGFYKHHGLSFTGIARAIWADLRSGDIVQGGSTISQQTAKSLFLTNDRTWDRKFIELLYTVQLERKYTKDEILGMYLNEIYFGAGAYGIEEAAQTYFGKSVRDLNLAESAMLAGLPKAPSKWSPFDNWAAAKKRQKVVLNSMVKTGVVKQSEADKAFNSELTLNTSRKKSSQAPYFVNEVIKYISERYENGANLLLTGGLRIDTTLDLKAQKAAQDSFDKHLKYIDPKLEGALVAIDPNTGYILAMVGGRNYATSQFNRATQAKRQPGSAFKPFVYTTAIEQGMTPATVITCDPVEFNTSRGIYKPTDFAQQPYHNKPFTLKEALAISDNIVAVKLSEKVGPQNIVTYAQRMGITSQLKPYISLALGTSEVTPLEMATAYAPLSNGGFGVKPILIKQITDSNGHVLEKNTPTKTRVLDPRTAYIITDMLKGVTQPGGTASVVGQVLHRPVAGKTGTTQNYADAWFVGYTPGLVAATYLGYDTNRKSVGSTGGKLAAPLWADFASEALKETPTRDFSIPAGVVEKTVCADTGLLATAFSDKTLTAYFVNGTEPTQNCPIHSGWPGVIPPHSLAPNEDNKPVPEDIPFFDQETSNRVRKNIPKMKKQLYNWLFKENRR